MTPLMYNAESQMKRILKLKTDARGYNTDRLNGLNCRLGSLKKNNILIENISLFRERRLSVGKAEITAFDKMGINQETLHILRVNTY